MKYTLMNKNTPVFDLQLDENFLYVLETGAVYNPEYAPFSINIDDNFVDRSSVTRWLKHRAIPTSRDNLRQGLSNLSYTDATTDSLLLKCHALSLSDQYWLCPKDSNISWRDINFFTNPFSDDVGLALFDNIKIDTPNLVSPCNSSAGWLRKKWIISDGKRYLLKGSSDVAQQEAYNEVIAGKVCELLEIPHVEYTLNFSDWKAYSLCEDFITIDTELISAEALYHKKPLNKNESKYEHFCRMCEEYGVKDFSARLDEMIVLDFIMANQDRHMGNFGVIRDVNTLEMIGFAPIFDTGTSLRYDTPTSEIQISLDIESQPFASFHNKQVKLVQYPERFDLSALNELPQFAYNIFSLGNTIDKQRADILCDVLETRIEMLEGLFQKRLRKTALLDLTHKTNGRK